jgi:hypothetical protein
MPTAAGGVTAPATTRPAAPSDSAAKKPTTPTDTTKKPEHSL